MHASNVLISGPSPSLSLPLASPPSLSSSLPTPTPLTDLIARHKADNPCSLYALNIAIDTTLGVLVLFGFLKLSTHLLLHYQPTYRTGDYGNPFSSTIWAKQVRLLALRAAARCADS